MTIETYLMAKFCAWILVLAIAAIMYLVNR